MLSIKEKLYNACVAFVEKRFLKIESTIADIQTSLLSETKSSAGDKHETGRAMLQIEREKAGQQLAEIGKVKEALSKVETTKTHNTIAIGSVVYTSKSNYYIAISAGELKFNNEKFYAISPSTPIGQLLMGKAEGERISFREQNFAIEKVC